MWDPTRDTWLAGFADGEATFLINQWRRGARPAFNPGFSLNLRADDLGVLAMLREAFGGRLVLDETPNRNSLRARPRYFWHVRAKADLARLVAYFDEFPLRSKKARDYAVWRQAVCVYCERGGVRAADELQALRLALTEARQFVAVELVGMDTPALAEG